VAKRTFLWHHMLLGEIFPRTSHLADMLLHLHIKDRHICLYYYTKSQFSVHNSYL